MKPDPIARAHPRSRGQNAPGLRAWTATVCIALAGVAWLGGCLDGAGPDRLLPLPPPPQGLVVSDPVAAPAATAPRVGTLSVAAAEGDSVVYVSLVSGTAPEGANATVRNLRSGFTVTTPVLGGGFDPVSVSAQFGDTLEIQVRDLSDVVVLEGRVAVPAARPPVVVRTEPPPRKRDVPLNAVMVVVFSEPIDPATLDTATVRLLRGTTPLAGAVGLRTGSDLVAEFVPESPLAAATTHRLVVTRGVRDLAGDSLEAMVEGDFTTEEAPPPPPPPPLPMLTFNSLTAGGRHTCAVTADSAAYCWGANTSAQLGTGDTVASGTPRAVLGGLRFRFVDAGGVDTCGLAPTSYCWGSGYDRPTATWDLNEFVGEFVGSEASLSTSLRNTCGVTRDGAAYCWGWFESTGGGWFYTPGPIPIPFFAGSAPPFVSVSGGGGHMCALTAVGAGYCWGANSYGELGDGTRQRSVAFVRDTLRVEVVPVLAPWAFTSLSAGDTHTCGVTLDEVAYCWGNNIFGQLGSAIVYVSDCANYPCSPTPIAVTGGLSLVAISAGDRHTCAIAADGAAYCWGDNASGQLGDGTTTSKSAPVPVVGGLAFRMLTAGAAHTCGITTGGVAYCWGDNSDGQLGDGRTTSRATPVRVAGQPVGE